jgi:hypothetical protein
MSIELVAGRCRFACYEGTYEAPQRPPFGGSYLEEICTTSRRGSRVSTAPAQHPRTHFVGRARARGSNRSKLS